jgi:nucleotide sugar dehydrogenase
VEKRQLTIGVVGLGYVGLPTAISFYNSGFDVIGVDISKKVVDYISNQKNPIGDPALDDKIPPLKSTRWKVTTSFSSSIPQCDVVIVTVPTPVNSDNGMDATYVVEAGKEIFSNLVKESGTIVILESTVYPGSTKELWYPLIKELDLELGKDLSIAYCPERHNPGDASNNISTVSRVIGCEDKDIGQSLELLYSELTSGEVRFVGDIEVAESAKLIENVQRDINIALVNELSTILPELGVDVEEVLEAASTKWNFHRYKPGIGVGGHCIPVDPYFIIDKASLSGKRANLVSSAREINESMPSHSADQINSVLIANFSDDKQNTVLILGWSYKADIGDTRSSPSRALSSKLVEMGVKVLVYDPHVEEDQVPSDFIFVNSLESLTDIDMVVLATEHTVFLQMDWSELMAIMRKPIIYDGRRCLNLEELREMGWIVSAIGL